MRPRHLIASLLSVALLGLPAVVAAPAAAAETVATSIEIQLEKQRVRLNDTFDVKGRITGSYAGEEGFVDNAEVSLERKFPGRVWRTIDTTTSTGYDGSFVFYDVRGVQNARYRVTYAGEAREYSGVQVDVAGSSSAEKALRVLRDFRLSSREKNHGVQFSGRVLPRYKNRPVQVMQRTCGKCRWKLHAKVRTNKRSRFSLVVPVPGRTGPRWQYRVVTPADKAFVASPSSQVLEVYRYWV